MSWSGIGHCLDLCLCRNLDEQIITRSGIEGDIAFFSSKFPFPCTANCKIIIKNKSRSAQTLPGEASAINPQAFYLFNEFPFINLHKNHNNKNTTITITISSGEASGIDPQAFYRGCGEPGVPAGQGLTCTVEQLFDVKVFFSVLSFLCGFVFVIAGGWLALSNNSLM